MRDTQHQIGVLIVDMAEEAAARWLDRMQAELEPSRVHPHRSPRR